MIPALAFALLAFAVLLMRRHSLGFGNTTFPEWDPDSLLRLRRMDQVLGSGGELGINGPDFFSSFPWERPYPYAPLMDFVGVHLTWLFHAFFPESQVPFDQIVGFIPPVLGAILVFCLFMWVFRRSGSLGFASLSALFLTTDSLFGGFWGFHMVDHHCLEGFFLWTWMMVGDVFVRDEGQSRWYLVAGGLLLCGFMLGWTGMTRLMFLIALAAGVFTVSGISWGRRFSEFLSGSLLVAGGLGVILLIQQGNTGHGILTFSWFQPVFLGALGLCLHFWSWMLQPGRSRWWFLCWPAVFGAFLYLYWGVIKIGIQVVTSEHPFFISIMEFAPYFRLEDFSAARRILEKVGWLFLFLPLGMYFAHARCLRGGGKAMTPIGIGLFFLGLHRVRYYRWVPFFQAIWLGAFFWTIFQSLAGRTRHLSFWPRLGLLFAGFGIPLGVFLGASIEKDYSKGREGILPVINGLAWLQRNSPDPGGYFDGKRPSYCVLSFWDKGNAVAYYAKRPPVCNNLILGLDRMAAVFAEPDDEQAYRKCREFDIRYWLVNPSMPHYSKLFSQLLATDFSNGSISLTRAGINWDEIAKINWDDTSHEFLYRYLGLGNSRRMGSRHFRLVYVGHDYVVSSGNPYVKIFEVVPGARIVGRGKPNVQMILRMKLDFPMMNHERGYYQTAVADAKGTFSFVVPYPTNSISGGVKTGAYTVSIPGDADFPELTVQVSEEAVRSGEVVDTTGSKGSD